MRSLATLKCARIRPPGIAAHHFLYADDDCRSDRGRSSPRRRRTAPNSLRGTLQAALSAQSSALETQSHWGRERVPSSGGMV